MKETDTDELDNFISYSVCVPFLLCCQVRAEHGPDGLEPEEVQEQPPRENGVQGDAEGGSHGSARSLADLRPR